MASTDTQKIAERYTRALFALAEERGALDAAEKDLLALKSIMAESAELARLFTNPLLPREAKAAAMEAILKRLRAHDVTRAFIRRLSLNGRLDALSAMITHYEARMSAYRGETVAEVISARPLTRSDAESVAKALGKNYGSTVRMHTTVDPTLLGGMVIRIGSRMIDYSLKNQLARLEKALKTA